jgi:hypothetical protein
MSATIRNVISNYGAIASLAGLYISLVAFYGSNPPQAPLTWWQILLAAIFFVFLIVLTIADVHAYFASRPKTYKTDREINDYMFKWISNGGRVAIFTRDMTWAHEERIENLLLEKARRGELCICAAKNRHLVAKLSEAGAEVYEYPDASFTPRARFTIVNRGRDDARVAVGGRVQGKFVIREYANGEHPFFSVAHDFVEFLAVLNRAQK